MVCIFFFFKQKTAYEMRMSDLSSDVCSSDLRQPVIGHRKLNKLHPILLAKGCFTFTDGPGSIADIRLSPCKLLKTTTATRNAHGPAHIRPYTPNFLRPRFRQSDDRRAGKECVRTCVSGGVLVL